MGPVYQPVYLVNDITDLVNYLDIKSSTIGITYAKYSVPSMACMFDLNALKSTLEHAALQPF